MQLQVVLPHPASLTGVVPQVQLQESYIRHQNLPQKKVVPAYLVHLHDVQEHPVEETREIGVKVF